MALLARLRAEVEQGSEPRRRHGVIRASPCSGRRKTAIERQLRAVARRTLIAKAMTRLAEAERQVKAPGGPGPVAADEELFAICRQAARLR